MNYYLVGIKGTGMSALASYLFDLGHSVTGSDIDECVGFEKELLKRNIKTNIFSKDNIKPNYVYIIGNAYHLENIEVQTIVRNDYKYYYYHEFISTLPGIKIGISGTHGKTTTSTFIKQLLSDEKIAYIIGDGSGYAEKGYKYLIYESCEYQDHFLTYKPDILVITNIDYDHPDYFKNINQTIDSFYRASKNANLIITLGNTSYNILKQFKDKTIVKIMGVIFEVPLVGIHNIENFVLAFQVLIKLGFDYNYIKSKFKYLSLPKRRTEELKIGNCIIIEDYAHHPTEIKQLHNMLEIKYPKKEKVVIFQPHTYSRTLTLIKDFISVLKLFDEVYIDKVFTSKREPYNKMLEDKVSYFFRSFKKYNELDVNETNEKIFVLLGAGTVNKRFKEKMKFYEKE